MASELKTQLIEQMKVAMKARDKARLGVIRLVISGVKQREIDEKIELTDADVLALLDKMSKQRRDSIAQFNEAGRTDLSEIEEFELTVLQDFLPEALTDEEISTMVAAAIADSGAESMRDMGKVMNIIRPQAQGRADMAVISSVIKAKLNA